MGPNNKNGALAKAEVGLQPIDSPYFRRDTFGANTEAERAILGLVLRRGPLTQTQIAGAIDRSQQTVSRLITRLIDRGTLKQGERVSSGKRGQLSVNVEIVPDYAYAFGVSLLWDALAVTLMDFSGRVIDRRLKVMTLMTLPEKSMSVTASASHRSETPNA